MGMVFAVELAHRPAPGEELSLALDVSVDGDREIPIDQARDLVVEAHSLFLPVHPFSGDQWLDRMLAQPFAGPVGDYPLSRRDGAPWGR